MFKIECPLSDESYMWPSEIECPLSDESYMWPSEIECPLSDESYMWPMRTEYISTSDMAMCLSHFCNTFVGRKGQPVCDQ